LSQGSRSFFINVSGKRSNMPNETLKNKVAIVTGSRRGIGRAVALAFAEAGADLVIADIVIDDRKLDKVAEEIKKMGCKCEGVKVDISRKSDVEKMVNTAVKRFGRIDILANCAGVWIPGQNLIETPEENWDRVIDTNLKGTYFCCLAAGRVMSEQKSGNIINLSSQVGLNPGTGAGAYSISKAGIIMMTRQLALELADKNIRVNALAPGIVKTDFNIGLWKDAKGAKQMGQMVPLGRLAEPEDIARAALFLASDDSSYITGAVIPVDGGWKVGASGRGR
jgi:NAD(P)-dependent dehydrogenase (short-subunit alcohol dehydrogenase family)